MERDRREERPLADLAFPQEIRIECLLLDVEVDSVAYEHAYYDIGMFEVHVVVFREDVPDAADQFLGIDVGTHACEASVAYGKSTLGEGHALHRGKVVRFERAEEFTHHMGKCQTVVYAVDAFLRHGHYDVSGTVRDPDRSSVALGLGGLEDFVPGHVLQFAQQFEEVRFVHVWLIHQSLIPSSVTLKTASPSGMLGESMSLAILLPALPFLR